MIPLIATAMGMGLGSKLLSVLKKLRNNQLTQSDPISLPSIADGSSINENHSFDMITTLSYELAFLFLRDPSKVLNRLLETKLKSIDPAILFDLIILSQSCGSLGLQSHGGYLMWIACALTLCSHRRMLAGELTSEIESPSRPHPTFERSRVIGRHFASILMESMNILETPPYIPSRIFFTLSLLPIMPSPSSILKPSRLSSVSSISIDESSSACIHTPVTVDIEECIRMFSSSLKAQIGQFDPLCVSIVERRRLLVLAECGRLKGQDYFATASTLNSSADVKQSIQNTKTIYKLNQIEYKDGIQNSMKNRSILVSNEDRGVGSDAKVVEDLEAENEDDEFARMASPYTPFTFQSNRQQIIFPESRSHDIPHSTNGKTTTNDNFERRSDDLISLKHNSQGRFSPKLPNPNSNQTKEEENHENINSGCKLIGSEVCTDQRKQQENSSSLPTSTTLPLKTNNNSNTNSNLDLSPSDPKHKLYNNNNNNRSFNNHNSYRSSYSNNYARFNERSTRSLPHPSSNYQRYPPSYTPQNQHVGVAIPPHAFYLPPHAFNHVSHDHPPPPWIHMSYPNIQPFHNNHNKNYNYNNSRKINNYNNNNNYSKKNNFHAAPSEQPQQQQEIKKPQVIIPPRNPESKLQQRPVTPIPESEMSPVKTCDKEEGEQNDEAVILARAGKKRRRVAYREANALLYGVEEDSEIPAVKKLKEVKIDVSILDGGVCSPLIKNPKLLSEKAEKDLKSRVLWATNKMGN